MNSGESDVKVNQINEVKGEKYCGKCSKGLMSKEKSCLSCGSSDVRFMPVITVEEEITPSIALATENPNPFYGSFGCTLRPVLAHKAL